MARSRCREPFWGECCYPDRVCRLTGRVSYEGLLYGAGLATAAVLLHSLHDIHRMFIYNKMATPPIALLVAACTTWAWALVYGLVDMRGWRR
ncbi:MAG: hypothetical protein VCF24_30040 [Candidatus Latescibacterota bacterium]